MANKLATARDVWLKIHLWLGLGIGLFFCIASFTGAIIVFQNELDTRLNAGAWPTTPGDVGVPAIVARIDREAPGSALRQLRWPQPQEPVYVADVVAADGERRTIRFDPGSGELIERVRANRPWLALARRMHTSLFAGRYGTKVVLYTSMAALFSLVTGLILWWPGVRRLVRGFVVRTRRGFYAFNFDLHQALGALSLPLLLLITLTGVLLQYGERFAQSRTVESEAAVAESGGTSADAQASLETLAAAGAAAVPEAMPAVLRLNEDAARPAEVLLQPGRWGRPGVVTVLLDRRDARVLEVRDPRAGDPLTRLGRLGLLELHVGAYGGTAVRLLYVVVCLVGAGLPISGALIWWLKRRKTAAVEVAAGARSRPAAGAAQPDRP